MDFYVCWSIDCESCLPGVNDVALGQRAIAGFCEILEQRNWRGTLFVMPEEIEHMAELLGRMHQGGHELGLHVHLDTADNARRYLGEYSFDEQLELFSNALDAFQRLLGMKPASIRPGYGSANDATFAAIAGAGFTQSSASFPGRKMTELSSNWAGAPLFAHYANPCNRFLEGGLDLVEFPISVDWETMVWGGIHPQDLRVEYTDAKNHGFTIRKIMKRQIDEDLPLKVLLPFTHNIFDYSDKANFRSETMQSMADEIDKIGRKYDARTLGTTLKEAGQAYRAAVPFK